MTTETRRVQIKKSVVESREKKIRVKKKKKKKKENWKIAKGEKKIERRKKKFSRIYGLFSSKILLSARMGKKYSNEGKIILLTRLSRFRRQLSRVPLVRVAK